MHEIAPLIYDLALMLGIASVVIIVFQRIKQPVVLGYLVAGMIVGPHTPPHALVNDIPNIRILSELGVIFLMFSLGLEFTFEKLTRVGFSASVTGFIEVTLMLILGYMTGHLLGWSFYDSLFLGAALSISSTTIIIKAIDELKLKTRDFAELIFGILIVEDLLAILLLVGLSTVVITHNIFSFDMVNATVRLILVVGSWFITGYFLVPPLFKKIAKYLNQETLTIITIALCLFLVCVAAYFHYSTALGAFIMGSILAETTSVRRIHELVQPIRDIFAAVFFVSVGMLIDPIIILHQWHIVIFIALVTIFGKLIITSVGAFLTGQNYQTSIRVGFSMAQVGEFSFIIVALGATLGVINKELYPIIVAVSGITTFATPYFIQLSAPFGRYINLHLPKPIKHYLQCYQTNFNAIKQDWQAKPLLSVILVRILINGMLVAIIFTLIHYFIFHYLVLFKEDAWRANSLLLIIALAIASPFIYGMMFSYQKKLTKVQLKNQQFLLVIIGILTFCEIFFLSLIYFNTWLIIILLCALACVGTIYFFSIFGKIYDWFEVQLLRNIGSKDHLQ